MKIKVMNITDLERFFGGVVPVVELVTHCPSDAGRIVKYMMNS